MIQTPGAMGAPGAIGVLAARLYAAGTAIFVLASLYVLSVASWTTLAEDQWPILSNYIRLDFPQNLFSLHNGHRQVFPGLLYLLDFRALGAQNLLLGPAGIASASMLFVLWSRTVWRRSRLATPDRTIAASLPWLLMLWLANARVLGHGFESVHVYLLLGALFLLAWAVSSPPALAEGRREPLALSGRRLLVAVGACSLATLTSGFGMATWPALLVLCLAAGYRLRTVAVLFVGFATALVSYTFLLPGAAATKSNLRLEPARWLLDAASWLGSPAYHLGRWWPGAAPDVLIGLVCPLLGAIGLAGAAVACWVKLRERRPSPPLESWCLAVLVFASASALLVAVARRSYFARLPGEVVAPRYLPWACAFWAAALIGFRLHSERYTARWRRRTRVAWLLAAVLLPFALLPSHRGIDLEYRRYQIEEGAIALLVGARHDSLVASRLNRHLGSVYEVAEHLRQSELGMFRWPHAHLLGRYLPPGSAAVRPLATLPGRLRVETFEDRGTLFAHFSGQLEDRGLGGGPWVLAVDDRGQISGLGLVRGTGHHLARRLRLLAPTTPLAFGHIRDFDPARSYRLYASSSEAMRALDVGPRPEWRRAAQPRLAGPRADDNETAKTVSPERRFGVIRADPNPIQVCDDSRVGIATLHWDFPEHQIELRVGAPDGKLWGTPPSTGSGVTGAWVKDGTTFFVQDRDAAVSTSPASTLATLVVRHTDAGCPR